MIRYWRSYQRGVKLALAAAERGQMFSEGPKAQHPQILADYCIGCGTCVDACPEGDVLALINGKAMIVNGHKCIGHGLCAEECPVGAIEMVMAKASATADMPALTEDLETSVPNLFIAGELGGLALIKNAVNQGRDTVDVIASRLSQLAPAPDKDCTDVLVVGAGPAGISASLRAAELRLSCVTLEREEVGGTVSKYPREKLVLTSPVEFPMHGTFRKMQLSKEQLLEFWNGVISRTDLNIHTAEGVQSIQRREDGIFEVQSSKALYRARTVILALGRSGTPRKLNVPGEELPHVLYRLIEADHYTDKHILIVGGGDSAIEAAMGLAHQRGNKVTLSYRRGEFMRIKERNAKKIKEHMDSGKVKVLFNSAPMEFRTGSVLMETAEGERELPNDCVWIFAGGEPPSAFLKAAGIAMGKLDLAETAAKAMSQ